MNVPQNTTHIPLPIRLTLSGSGATGVTLADIAFKYHDGEGGVGTMSEDPPLVLQEIDAVEFPGEYLLVDYPEALTAKLGRLRIKWAAVPAVCDAGEAEFDVDASATYLRDLWLTLFGGDAEFDAEESTIVVKDEDGNAYKKLLLRNKDGGDVVITGQGPVTRRAAVDP